MAWQSFLQDGDLEGIVARRFLGPGSLEFVAGDGVDDSAVTVRGTAENLTWALDGLEFRSLPDYFGPASISLSLDDLGNTGTGGPETDADVVSIDVTPVERLNWGAIKTLHFLR